MPSAKSKTALKLNVQYLAHFNGAKCCSFWTFTLPCVLHPYDAASSWRLLCKDLVRDLGFRGIRVFELHPSGHGLHVHAVAVGRYDIRKVLCICKKHGWGRVGVELVHSLDADNIGVYLGKYLSKQVKLWHGCPLKGMRWWGSFGKVADKVRVSDVRISSERSRIYRRLTNFHVLAVFAANLVGVDLNSRLFRFYRFKLATALYLRDPAFVGPFVWDFWLDQSNGLNLYESFDSIVEKSEVVA